MTNRVPDTWGLSKAQIDDLPALVRYRSGIDTAETQDIPNLLCIEWAYETDDETLLPTSLSEDEMQTFENRLVPLVEEANDAVLAVVITHRANRRWYFYSKDTSKLLDALHEMPQEANPYPLTLSSREGECWDFYRDVIAQYSEN